MTALPSPIPHPRDHRPIDVPRWARDPLAWVIGQDWPTGDEAATWAVADRWFAVASSLEAPHEAAFAAAAQIMTGPDNSDFHEAWQRLAGDAAAPLNALPEIAAELGDLVDECARTIEAAKLETWTEITQFLADLTVVRLTSGIASPAAAALIATTRLTIHQIFTRLTTTLAADPALRPAAQPAAQVTAQHSAPPTSPPPAQHSTPPTSPPPAQQPAPLTSQPPAPPAAQPSSRAGRRRRNSASSRFGLTDPANAPAEPPHPSPSTEAAANTPGRPTASPPARHNPAAVATGFDDPAPGAAKRAKSPTTPPARDAAAAEDPTRRVEGRGISAAGVLRHSRGAAITTPAKGPVGADGVATRRIPQFQLERIARASGEPSNTAAADSERPATADSERPPAADSERPAAADSERPPAPGRAGRSGSAEAARAAAAQAEESASARSRPPVAGQARRSASAKPAPSGQRGRRADDRAGSTAPAQRELTVSDEAGMRTVVLGAGARQLAEKAEPPRPDMPEKFGYAADVQQHEYTVFLNKVAEETRARIRDLGRLADQEIVAGSARQGEELRAWSSQLRALLAHVEKTAAKVAAGFLRPAVVLSSAAVDAEAPAGAERGDELASAKDARSALNGSLPIDLTRRYDTYGGLRAPHAVHQQAFADAVPEGGDGRAQRLADPRVERWFGLANADGPVADPARGLNCVDGVLALFDTYLHGRPRVAAARTFDSYAAGEPNRPVGGEWHGLRRIELATGTTFQNLCPYQGGAEPDAAQSAVDVAMRNLSNHLHNSGHGSFAFILTDLAGGGCHAWAAVNHEGTILFLDPQIGRLSENTPLYRHNGARSQDNVASMDALVVDGQGVPAPLPYHGAGQWSGASAA